MPADAAFSDETAAALMMLPVPRTRDVVHVTVGVGTCVPRRRGIAGHVRQLRAEDLAVVHGLCVVTAACTFVHLAAVLSRAALVGLGDAILRASLATTAELLSAVDANRGRRGCVRARELIPILDAKAESVMESVLRLLLLDAGFPAPEVNANVYDSYGQFLARADLLYRAAKVIIEYDGDTIGSTGRSSHGMFVGEATWRRRATWCCASRRPICSVGRMPWWRPFDQLSLNALPDYAPRLGDHGGSALTDDLSAPSPHDHRGRPRRTGQRSPARPAAIREPVRSAAA